MGSERTLPLQQSQNRNAKKSNFLAMLANFNIQYNFTSASIAVDVVSTRQYLGHPLYSEPGWSDTVTLAAVFIGAMLGMLCMGRMGDLIGRSKAMRVTTALAMIGAIIPALAAGPPNIFYGVLCFGRLILGIGVGGIYPLSAVHSAEGSASAEGRGNRVSWAFFWQTPGLVVPYLIAMLLFATINADPPAEWAPQLEFRLLFALGAVPACIVFLASFLEEESGDFMDAAARESQPGVIEALRREPRQSRITLAGTAGTWFCYDIAFYGTGVFTPTILENICMAGTKDANNSCDQTMMQTAMQSALVGMMGLPGCLLAILLIQRLGSKRLNTYGMLLLAVNFAAMGFVYAFNSESTILLFTLFCTLTFLLNFGPNLGTFVLPAVCFPAHIRSTCYGLSAFGGKVGAIVGTLIFPLVSDSAGLPPVLWGQAIVCIIGAIVCQWTLKHDWEYMCDDDRIATESFLHGQSVASQCR